MNSTPSALYKYLILLSCFTIGILGISILIQTFWYALEPSQLVAAVVLMSAALAADLRPIYYRKDFSQTVSTAIYVAAALVLPPILVIVMVLVNTAVSEILSKKPWVKIAFNTNLWAILFGVTSLSLYYNNLVYYNNLQRAFTWGPVDFLKIILIFCVYALLSTGLMAIVIALANERKITSMWRESLKFFNVYDIALLPYGLILGMLWSLSFWHFLIGLIPIVAIQRSFADHAGFLKEQLRTAELVEQQRRVHEAMTVLLSGRTMHEQLDTLLEHIIAVFPVRRAGVVLWGEYAQPDAFVTHDDQALEALLRVWRDDMYSLSASSQMLRLDQAYSACQVDDLPLWLVPLATPDGSFGSLLMVGDRTWEPSPQQQRLVETFASQAALAINQSRLIERLQETRKQLIESERLAAIGGLAAGVAHEFNNLLSVLSGNVQVAMDESDEAERQALLNTVVQLALNGTSITEGLLRFGRREEPKRQETNLVSVVDAVLMAFKNDCKSARVTLVRDFDAVPPIVCEAGAISQVLINLLYNALDAIHPNAGTLTVRLKQHGSYVAIAVEDTGCGIPPDILHTIFEPFMTTKLEHRDKLHGGTGLGLSVSHGIIANHGGRIDVASEVGKGSIFTVYLPINVPATSALEPTMVTPFNTPHLHAVVVDDEPSIAQALGRMLSRDGHTVEWFTKPEEAIAAICRSPVDVVFADLRMPGMDGLALLECVKQQAPTVECVLMSGHIDPQNRQQAREHGVNVIIEKPFDFSDVRRALHTLAMSGA
jgi:signal transduction histidine kinase/CheY-like chemotaxis protein